MSAFSDTAFNTSAFSPGAFDFGSGPAPVPPDITPSAPVGGGIPFQGRFHLRTKEDISKDRARFGLSDKVAEVVSSVAARQAENLVDDAQKRFEELAGELKLRDIEFEGVYLEALNAERQRLIDAEIGSLLRRKIDDEDMAIMLMLVAACV